MESQSISGEEILQKLYDEIRSSNLTQKDVDGLPALRKLLEITSDNSAANTPPGRTREFRIFFYGLPCLLVLACVLMVSFPHFTVNTIHKLGYGDRESSNSDCLLRGPVKFTEWFRPPVDCMVCRNVTQVDVVDDITVQEFTDKYAYSSRPLVVRGALKNWTASRVFSYEFLQKLYLDEFPGALEVVEEHCQFFKYKTEFSSLREVLTMSPKRFQEKWYVGWSNCDVGVAGVLRQHYTVPPFLPIGSASSRLDWIFMGRAGYGANIHIDNVGRPSWQAQIRGTKVWHLQPPRECFFECNNMEVTVHPNDIIVLDTDIWYHGTTITGKDISITIGSEYD